MNEKGCFSLGWGRVCWRDGPSSNDFLALHASWKDYWDEWWKKEMVLWVHYILPKRGACNQTWTSAQGGGGGNGAVAHLNIFACGLSTLPTYVHNISKRSLDGMPMHRLSASIKLRLLATNVGVSILIHWRCCNGSALPNIPSMSWLVWSHLGNTKSSTSSIFCRTSIGCWLDGSKQKSLSSSLVNDWVHPTNVFLAKPTVWRVHEAAADVRSQWSEARYLWIHVHQLTVPVGDEVLHCPANPVSITVKPAFWAITYEAVWFTFGVIAPRVGAPTMYPGLPLRTRVMILFFSWLRMEASTSMGTKFTEYSCCSSRVEVSISIVSMSTDRPTIVVRLYLTL